VEPEKRGSRSSSRAQPNRRSRTEPCSWSSRRSRTRGSFPGALAAALELRALPGQELVDALVDFLASRSTLLLLDNCEHVLAAAAALSNTLLRAAPRLTILATSREPLRVAGEVVFRVPSLDIPDPEHALSPERLVEYEAVRLFVVRARSSDPGFEFDAANAGEVARICLRLDGLPLAIELAAGRVGALGAAAIAARLDERFGLLRAATHASPRGSRRSRRRSSGATTSSSRTSGSSSGASRSSPAASSSRQRRPCGPGTISPRSRLPTCWRGSSRNRSSSPRADQPSAATGCSRRCALRGRAARRGGRGARPP
jgi:hypothetical protein